MLEKMDLMFARGDSVHYTLPAFETIFESIFDGLKCGQDQQREKKLICHLDAILILLCWMDLISNECLKLIFYI